MIIFNIFEKNISISFLVCSQSNMKVRNLNKKTTPVEPFSFQHFLFQKNHLTLKLDCHETKADNELKFV